MKIFPFRRIFRLQDNINCVIVFLETNGDMKMAMLFQNPDGANAQARAVLAYLSNKEPFYGMDELQKVICGPEVDRWHNCREQGYVVRIRSFDSKRQLNIAFFEHRNSDDICAVEFEALTLNPATIADIPEDCPYMKSKYNVSKSVEYGRVTEMADWIFERIKNFWEDTKPKV